jgi:hypothetical protein
LTHREALAKVADTGKERIAMDTVEHAIAGSPGRGAAGVQRAVIVALSRGAQRATSQALD